MIETRKDDAYAGRVWATRVMVAAVEREARARIEALLPLHYTYDVRGKDGEWRATFGRRGEGGTWGCPHMFRTKEGALLGLLATMVDGCVYPKCATAFGAARAEEALAQFGPKSEGD